MKKYMKLFVFPVLLCTAFLFNGCILDAFDTLTQGFPITIDLNLTGIGDVSSSETFDLDDSDFYNSNKDKINKIKFIKVAYRTKATPVPANLQGNVNVTIKKGDGTVLFTYVINNIKPADYIDQAYELQLTQGQIQAVNAYIGTLSNKTFIAEVSITNVNSAVTISLQAIVDIAFEMEYDL